MTKDFQVSAQERKLATRLYAQQMWLWGRDIRYPKGNLLKSYGFSYRRDVEENGQKHGSSQYGYTWNHNGKAVELSLWSFGLTIACEHGNILLERHKFRPRWLCDEVDAALSSTHDFPEAVSPPDVESRRCTGELLTALAQRVIDYEEWIAQQVPPEWRQQVVKDSPERFKIPVEDTIDTWKQLKDQWSQRLNKPQEPAQKEYKIRGQKPRRMARAKSLGLGLQNNFSSIF